MTTFLPGPNIAVFLFMLIAGIECVRHPGDRRREQLFLSAIGFTVFLAMIGLFISPAIRTNPLRLDEYLLYTDGWFGYPSFQLGIFLDHHQIIHLIASTVYVGYLVPVVVLPFIYLNRDRLKLLRVMALNFVLCFPLYMLCPASGPHDAFATFPYQVPSIAHPHAINVLAPPNCMPSVHMSTALLVLCFLQPWKIGRVFGWFWVTFTIIATLGFGEHYLLDLIAAIPYTGLMLYLGGYRLHIPTPWRELCSIEPSTS